MDRLGTYIAASILVIFSQAVVAQKSSPQSDLDALGIKLEGALKEISALEESDKKLKESDARQLETKAMLDRAERKIRAEEVPEIQRRANAADAQRQQAINSGCPEGGGSLPIAEANRCNALVQAHAAVVRQIEADAEALKRQLTTIEQGQAAVSATTLANFQKRKENGVRRNELEAMKTQLRVDMIKRSLAIQSNRVKAPKVCRTINSDEKAHCCASILTDGTDPGRCDAPLVFQVFEQAGFFRTAAVKPR